MQRPSFLSLLAAAGVLALSACATPEPAQPEVLTAQVKDKDCVKTIGTSICRRPDQGAMAPAVSVSGETLRRHGTDLVPPPPGRGE